MRGVFVYPEKIRQAVHKRKKTDEKERPMACIDCCQEENNEKEREKDELERLDQGDILEVETVQADSKNDGDHQKNDSSIHSHHEREGCSKLLMIDGEMPGRGSSAAPITLL